MPITLAGNASDNMAAPSVGPSGKGMFVGDWGSADKITLLVETSGVFDGLVRIEQGRKREALQSGQQKASIMGGGSSSLLQTQAITEYHRFSSLYRNTLVSYRDKLLAYEKPDEAEVQLVSDIHAAFHLAETLYLPLDGAGAGVVGEEILHWLNAYDIAPTTEEGQDIASAATPYDHPRYWDYIYQCVLRGFNASAASVLASLKSHPASVVGRVADKTIKLLQQFPRSTSYSHEYSFIQDRKQWQAQVRHLLSGLEAEMDEMEEELGHSPDNEDRRIEVEAQFMCLLELMAGVKERVFEASADWKEALGSWGLLVHPSMKRDDVPDVMSIILDRFPADMTLALDKVLTSFTKGDVLRACISCHDYDPWLALHLTDLLGRAAVLEDDDDPSKPTKLRKDCVREYASVLLEDQGLWRMAIDYLASIGPEGRGRMRRVVLDVPLLLDVEAEPAESSADKEMLDAEGDEMDSGDALQKGKGKAKEEDKVLQRFRRVEELLRACVDHQMEAEARAICKSVAEKLAEQREYGTAVSYCVRAGDATQVRRIADAVLDAYVDHGATEFIALVNSFPPSLLKSTSRLPTTGVEGDVPFGNDRSLYSERLAFLGKYRDFHVLYSEERLHEATAVLVSTLLNAQAPERFWAILLLDAVPLLESDLHLFEEDGIMELIRYYEQVTTGARTHPSEAEHYLGMLERMHQSKGSRKSQQVNVAAALKRLEVVRLGLARNLSKVFLLESSRMDV
ncbi:hypothetical protein K437DRAFT_265737 [Tilletiaria anomala UBC 951]|uniref:Nuclear pore complex protein Nup85 n=1 Tax=Tilletiaria anomala (strain ATCC 24038 / CBS 436.72 / UBC 951) TaxID=1037660 RepID=A0A066WHB9_TILAU|nr:uncharacterized protein K437DRAFT_265737 [Tilletiaria anomala UBC 951]KDN53367.1 hypothetical protein K437DRAFT_265737 [Tilletiaria anomala UBC 951]